MFGAAVSLPAFSFDRSSSGIFPLLVIGGGIGAVLVLALLLRALFGAGRLFPYERCEALFTPAVRHLPENMTDADMEVILVELKTPKRKPAAKPASSSAPTNSNKP